MITRPSSKKSLQGLLPWFLNGTLDPAEHEQVRELLNSDEKTRAEYDNWAALQAAIKIQPHLIPPVDIWRQISQRNNGAGKKKYIASRWVIWSTGIIFSILSTIILWILFQPGIGVRWSVAGVLPREFRIYRATGGNQKFQLIKVMAAEQDTIDYAIIDNRIFPGNTYSYRVEGVGESGDLTISQSIFERSFDVLFSQVAIIIISLLCGYSIILILTSFPFKMGLSTSAQYFSA